jgi:MFS family permease
MLTLEREIAKSHGDRGSNRSRLAFSTQYKDKPNFLTTLSLVKLARLLEVRWLGQLTDGLFQSALASFVLFSPERQPSATSAALAFTVVLLPYSLVGPYAGIFLDRFSRKRIVQSANVARALVLIIIAVLIKSGSTGIALTLFVLVAFGINRLILSGLSAGLPLIVTRERLITANALAVTGGTIGVVIGGGIGIGIKNILDRSHKSDVSDFVLILAAATLYLITALLISRWNHKVIGPTDEESDTESGWRDMLEGFHILRSHGDSLRGICATAIQRGGLTALTLMGLLLERNTYNAPTNPDAGLRSFAFAMGIAGVGVGLGSIVGPWGVIRYGRHLWIRFSMVGPIPFLLLFAALPHQWTLIVAAFFVGLCGQSVKVTNDALVQAKIEDHYRGRIFAFYDVAVNGAIVLGAIVAAIILPRSGKSWFLPISIAALYLLTSMRFLRTATFSGRSLPTK